MGIEPTSPLGPGYGLASDPNASIYSDGNNPFQDSYMRTSSIIQDLTKVMNTLTSQGVFTNVNQKPDIFLEEIDEYKNLKILRTYENLRRKVDIFISFEFFGEEFFGVYRNFNDSLMKSRLKSDIFNDPRCRQIDNDYFLKLNNYFYKILERWFIPDKGLYKNLKEDNIIKNELGQNIKIKKNAIIDVIGSNIDKDNDPYIILKYKNEKYTITKNNYYFFKYRFKK